MDLFPALESLYLDLNGPSFIKTNAAEIRPMTLPALLSLEIRVEEPVAHAMIRNVFRFFQLPNLRRLVLRWRTSQTFALETFLSASRPPLEELSLTTSKHLVFKKGPITRILRLLPGLRKLRIRHQHAILRELTLSESRDVGSFPLLEEVTLEIKEKPHSTNESTQALWKATEDMIGSRWKNTTKDNFGGHFHEGLGDGTPI